MDNEYTNDDSDSALDALLEAIEAGDGFLSHALRSNCVSYIFQQLTAMMELVIVTMIAGVYYLNEMLKVSMAEWSK